MTTLQEKLRSLPLEIQDAITSPEFGEKVDAIGEKHNLHIDQLGELVNEVTLVMLGETKSVNFIDNLKESLKISHDDARLITADVNTEIFLPLRDALQREESVSEPNPVAVPQATHRLETPDEILKHIEDGGLELPSVTPPAPTVPDPVIATAPAPTPTPTVEESKDLTEHLLKNTVASPHIEETKVEKKYNIDPYREPIM